MGSQHIAVDYISTKYRVHIQANYWEPPASGGVHRWQQKGVYVCPFIGFSENKEEVLKNSQERIKFV
jgi:hypothetical protein